MTLQETIKVFQANGYKLVKTKNKIPVVANWQKLLEKPEMFAGDLETTKECGFVLPPEILVIDVDPRNFKTNNPLYDLSKDVGNYDFSQECNFVVSTASKGFHLYFKKKSDVIIPNIHKNYAGIEFKSKGRQVIIPSSVLPDGRSYSIMNPIENLSNLKELPESFYKLFDIKQDTIKIGDGIKDEESDIDRMKKVLKASKPAIQGENGDNYTYNICLIGKDFGISPNVFFPYLCEWNINNQPPWGQDELYKKMLNAYKYGKHESGCDSISTIFKDTEEKKSLTPQEAKKQKEELVSWKDELSITSNGGYHKNLKNTVMFLLNDPILKDNLMFDKFSYNKIWKKGMPWHGNEYAKNISDTDYIKIRYLLNEYGFDVSTNLIYEGIVEVSTRNSFHPVRDFFNGLPDWDGVKRISNFFTKYCGVQPNAYTREVSKKMFGGIVNRIFKPGCKFDYIPILKGDQGIGKSMLIKALAIQPEWFTDDLGDITNMKDFIPQTIGKVVLEWAEMKLYNKIDIDSTKSFLSTQVGRVRRAHDREAGDYPRQFIIIGTTNKDKFLLDETGNRRFLPINIPGKINVEGVKRDLKQIYAEAFIYYLMGDSLEITNKEALEIADKARDFHFKNDELEESIIEWIETIETNGTPNDIAELVKEDKIQVNDVIIYCFKESILKNKGLSNRIGTVLRRIGYRAGTFRYNNRVRSGFVKYKKST